MKLNALIEQLVEIQKACGDIPVVSDEGYALNDAYMVKPIDTFVCAKAWGFKEGENAVLIAFDN